jgi:hypothetical protein
MARIFSQVVARTLAGFALVSLAAAAQGAEVHGTKAAANAGHGNADAIGEDELKAHLYFLASDTLEGRNFPSRGYDTAALYVASQLAQWGLKPGGSTSGTQGPLQPYFMPIEMEFHRLVPEESQASVSVSPDARPGEQATAQIASFGYGKN